jgi:hypothetical protein
LEGAAGNENCAGLQARKTYIVESILTLMWHMFPHLKDNFIDLLTLNAKFHTGLKADMKFISIDFLT